MTSANLGRVSLASLALTTLVAAQSLAPCPTQHLGNIEVRPWPGRALHGDECRDMVRAHLTGTGYPDFVFLCGNDPILVVAPAMVNQIVTLPGTAGMHVNELCLVASPGTPDKVAMLDTHGLHLWSRGTAPNYGVIDELVGVTWANYSNLNYSTRSDRLIAADDTLGQVAWVDVQTGTTGSFAVGGEIKTIEVLDWNNDGADEVFVVTDLGMTVFDLAGNTITSSPSSITEAFSTTIEMFTGEMAAIVCTSYGFKWLVTSGHLWYEGTPIGQDVVSISSGSVFPGPWNDLAIGYSNNPDLGLLINTGMPGEMFLFAPGGGVDVPFPDVISASNNVATANITDYDGDGFGDLLYPIESKPQIAVGRSPFAPAAAPAPRYIGVDYEYGRYHGPLYGDELTLLLDTSIAAPQAATHLQVTTWTATEYNGIIRTGARLDNEVEVALVSHYAPLELTTFVVDGMQNRDGVMMMLRFITLNGTTIEHAWPPEFSFCTVHDDILNIATGLGMQSIPGGIGGSSTGGVASHGSLPPPQDSDDSALPVVR